MKYTLEQIEKTYCIFAVDPIRNTIWFYINRGEFFSEHTFNFTRNTISQSKPKYNSEDVKLVLSCFNPECIVSLDYENFIRHFGLRFMKF